jgi:hypothetical protein
LLPVVALVALVVAQRTLVVVAVPVVLFPQLSM